MIIQYVKETSERIAKIYKKYRITTVMKPVNTLRQNLVHPKDKIPQEKSSGAVYQIPCKNCENSYIGKTGKEYSTRKNNHLADVSQNQKRSYTRSACKDSQTEYNKSAITVCNTQH